MFTFIPVVNKTLNQKTLNTQFHIIQKNYTYSPLIGGINQNDNREITQSVGWHICIWHFEKREK